MTSCWTGQEPIDRGTGESGSRRVRVLLLLLLASSGPTTKMSVSSERAIKSSRNMGEVNRWLFF